MMDVQRWGKRAGKILAVIICGIAAGYLLQVLVFMIPAERLGLNVQASVDKLYEEGTYPSIYLKGTFLDNWTEADSIAVTVNECTDNPFYNALNAYQKGAGVDAFYQTLHGTAELPKSDHSYLWHGFRIWLRVLLCKYDLQDIRFLCFAVNLLLVFLVCMELSRRGKNRLGFLPFAMAYVYFNFTVESLSLMFFNDIFVMLAGCLAVIWCWKRQGSREYMDILFAVIGMAVAFTSMLILPMLTLGFPLVMLLSLSGGRFQERMIMVVKYSVCWLAGYAVTMFSKILLSLTFINHEAGSHQVLLYSGLSGDTTIQGRMQMLQGRLAQIRDISEVKWDLLCLAVILCLAVAFVRKCGLLHGFKEYLPVFVVALYPFVWIFVMVVHATHAWTCFNFSITIYAVLQSLWDICLNGRKRSIGNS